MTQLEQLLSEPMVRRGLIALVGVILIFTFRWIGQRTLNKRVDDNTTRYRARKLAEFTSYVVIAAFLGLVFHEQLGGLTVALGVAGAGIAFALQEVIASVAGWTAVTFGNFYRIGDRVMLGGIRGDVIDIGVLRTTVFEVGDWVSGDLYNGRVVRIANSFVFKEPVFNYSADFPFLWDEVKVPVRHDSDRVQARQILEQVADRIVGEYAREVQSTWDEMTRNYVIEHARVLPMVTMTMNENWLTFTVRFVTPFKGRRGTKDQLFSAILDAFDATSGQVRVATAAQEVTLVKAEPM